MRTASELWTHLKTGIRCCLNRYRPPIPRRSAIPGIRHSGQWGEKNLYKGSVVRVSASYRPSSKVVECGRGVWEGAPPSPGKKMFLYTGSVVRVSARSSFIADLRNDGPPEWRTGIVSIRVSGQESHGYNRSPICRKLSWLPKVHSVISTLMLMSI